MYLFYMVSRVVKVLPIQEFTTKTPTYLVAAASPSTTIRQGQRSKPGLSINYGKDFLQAAYVY